MSNVEPISPYFRASACSCSKTADWIDLTFGVVVTIAIILGDFNAVTGSDRHGFESVIGNYGSGRTNDNSTRLLSL